MKVYIVTKEIKWEGWEELCFVTTDLGQADYVADWMGLIDKLNYVFSDPYAVFEHTLFGELT